MKQEWFHKKLGLTRAFANSRNLGILRAASQLFLKLLKRAKAIFNERSPAYSAPRGLLLRQQSSRLAPSRRSPAKRFCFGRKLERTEKSWRKAIPIVTAGREASHDSIVPGREPRLEPAASGLGYSTTRLDPPKG